MFRRFVWICFGSFFWLSAIVACHKTERVPLSQHTQSIIGGQKDLRYPAVGALTNYKNSFCTGTLIAKRVILTAAHCIDAAKRNAGFGGLLQFRIDLPDKREKDGYKAHYLDLDTTLFRNHPKWAGAVNNGYDVGIAILKKKTELTPIIPPSFVQLSPQWVGRPLLFLGYGLIQSTPQRISAKRKYGVEIPIVQVLADRFSHRAAGKSVCHGDSGGPALVQINGRLRVIGVNSYVTAPRVPNANPPRSTCTGTGTSMRTDAYTAFIQSALKTYGDGPESCKSNAECGSCGVCNQNSCQPTPIVSNPKHCQPCKYDGDCKGGLCYRFPQGYRCLQACDGKGCCPGSMYCATLQTQKGLRKLCVPFENQCPALPCKRSRDCGPGEFCENGKCLPRPVSRRPQLCQACQENKDCGSGGFCFGLEGNKRCSQPCNAGDFCPPGTTCQAPYPGIQKQCLPTNGACQTACMFNSHCPQGQTCNVGVCGSKQGSEYGDACDPTPCKEGLVCATTISGKRCLAPCGIPTGLPGSACSSGNRCNEPLRCYPLNNQGNLCLLPCNSNNDCQKYGGGYCSQGVCLCRTNRDCQEDHVCNGNSIVVGACAPKDKALTCKVSSHSCNVFNGASYCVTNQPGNRGLNQPCDSLNRCKEGLQCVQNQQGGRCLESCRQGGTCQGGGRCNRVRQGMEVCMCQSNLDCPKGQACKLIFGRLGHCSQDGNQGQCNNDPECPPNYRCIRGACLTGTDLEKALEEEPPEEIPHEETNPEEPTVPEEPSLLDDSGPPEEIAPEPKPETTPEPKPEPKPEPIVDPPEAGCRCSSHKTPLTFSWMWLLCFFALLPRRRQGGTS